MKKQERLFSLDLLRGLDMFLLTVIGPLFWAVHWLSPFSDAVTTQFRHPWGGFTLWDIIMPLFIFMCGAAGPYALSKRMTDGKPTAAYWRHVILRVLLLWFCGLLVQGDLASLNVDRIYPYSNTLQSIAVGYLVAAVVLAIPVRAARIAAPLVLAGVYSILLHFLGDYTTTGNYAFIIEKKVLTAILPASSELARGISKLAADVAPGTSKFHYTWWLTSLMFGAMTLCGAQCAEILRGARPPRRKALVLFLLGTVLLGAGWALVPFVPPIKHIYTVSFTCQAMGWSTLLLALLYTITDIAGFRAGMWVFTLYGQCALTAYMTSHFFAGALQKAAEAIVRGVPHLLGADAAGLAAEQVQHLQNVQGVVVAATVAALLTGILWIRRRLPTTSAAVGHEAESARIQKPDPARTHGGGAVAERFRLPGMADAQSAPAPKQLRSDEPLGPKMASKVRLQLHRKPDGEQPPEPPTVRLKPVTK